MCKILTLLSCFLLAFSAHAADITNLSGAQLPGTTTNDNAAAGNVGEYIVGTAAIDSVSITTGTPVNVGSISLTAGDWDVSCQIVYLPGATTTVSALEASLSATTGTRNGTLGAFAGVTYNALVLNANERITIT